MATQQDDFFIKPDSEVEKEKEMLQELAEKLKTKQKNVKRLKKEKIEKRIQHVGEIADKAGILHLNDDVLKGAFLFIASKINDIDQLIDWKEKG